MLAEPIFTGFDPQENLIKTSSIFPLQALAETLKNTMKNCI